ncbi:hypothetical protein C8Q79DRAFT_1007249 [Trametes meyenii]|nr:hypothetical protein C8Q79DRAFT_1007249 [Trametes meyenii]
MSSPFERLAAQRGVAPPDSGIGRSLQELIRTNERLSGAESQRLRTYFSSNSLEPSRDFDEFGMVIMLGDLETLKTMFAESVDERRNLVSDEAAARTLAAQEIYHKRWGPTRVPVFNLILLCSLINPTARAQHHAIAQWLINDVKMPIDGVDLSGSTALHHAISTKPAFEPEYAKILYDAGADVNHRNRYGGTPAHEAVMTWDIRNREVVRRAADALAWFLAHGGNIDTRDTDGNTVRAMIDKTRALSGTGLQLDTWRVVDDEDMRRRRQAKDICRFCGRRPRTETKLLLCSACKKAQYCSQTCQKGDWPNHKLLCEKVVS